MFKISRAKKAKGMVVAIEHLPSKQKALSSNSSTVLPPKIYL
jgi:hypothetical protein